MVETEFSSKEHGTMIHKKLLMTFFVVATFILSIGCIEVMAAEEAAQTPPPGSQPLAVKEAPPAAPQADTIPKQPSPEHVWQPGFWTWKEGNSWVWVPGRWEVPPHGPCGTWIPGHWIRGWQGYWHWVPGHWACYY
jgi:hypothetical protein